MFLRTMKGIIPAVMGASTVTPVCSLSDISVVKSAKSGGMMDSIIDSGKNFRLDMTSFLNFSIGCTTLLSTNFIKGNTKQIVIGTTICMALSSIKDTLLLEQDTPAKTKLMFVLRDGIANSPCLIYPGGNLKKQFGLIIMVQIPCTFINSYAIDYCIFSEKKETYMCQETYDRIMYSFYTSYPIRVTRSMFAIGLSTWINHSVKNILKFN